MITPDLSDFYHQLDHYAMVLDFDARNIAAMSREDACTYWADDPSQLYSFAQRVQILSGQVAMIFEKFSDHHPDPLTKTARLESALREREKINRAKEELFLVSGKRDALELYRHVGTTQVQISAMLHHYQENSFESIDREREAFKFLFGREMRPGETVLDELMAYQAILSDARRLWTVLCGKYEPLSYVHPLQTPNALLAITPSQNDRVDNDYGKAPYNEISFDLSHSYTPGMEPISVKAILIDWYAFQTKPEQFKPPLKSARSLKIPVLIKGA